jgi:competence protein ComEA
MSEGPKVMGTSPSRVHTNTQRTINSSSSRFIWQQDTLPYPAVNTSTTSTSATSAPSQSDAPDTSASMSTAQPKKRSTTRMIAVALGAALAVALYLVWRSSPSTPTVGISQQGGSASITISSTATTLSAQSTDSIAGTIAVYITGAVEHPGVYMLPPDARVYQVLQAAGGALPDANLVALNLAAKVSDGQEIYVPAIGESVLPPISDPSGTPTDNANGGNIGSSGQLVNINTASVDELRQALHISSTTAQNIVNYRVQHGAYTSVDQLLQVVSKAIYNKIKNEVTVS